MDDRAKLEDWIFEPLWAIKAVLDCFGLIWAKSLVSQPSPKNSGSNFLWDTPYVVVPPQSYIVGIICATCSANLASKIDQ